MKSVSILGFVAIVVAALSLWRIHSLFARVPLGIAFGLRSFHAGANPTAGGLVTTGPYRFIRHPIYAAICLFLWTGVLAHPSPAAASLGMLATAGAIARLFCEEWLVLRRYPEYRVYCLTTKRLVPGVW